jgi:uncharacterized membrane protein YkvA (DUF1232 family)
MATNKNVQNQVGMLRGLVNHVRLIVKLMQDKRVPFYLKALPIAAMAYFVMPIDFVPDFIIGLGQLDDIAGVLVGMEAFIRMCPPDVVAQLRADMNGDTPFTSAGNSNEDTVDGQWRTK